MPTNHPPSPRALRPLHLCTWKGPWLIAVAAVHTLFGIIVFPEVILSMLTQGVFNSVGNDPLRGAVVWFVLFGALLAVLGASVWKLERTESGASQPTIGAGLLTLTAVGLVLMPASGFWLALPPGLALLWPAHKVTQPFAKHLQSVDTTGSA